MLEALWLHALLNVQVVIIHTQSINPPLSVMYMYFLPKYKLVYKGSCPNITTVKPVLRDRSRGKKKFSLKTGGLLKQVNYRENCTLEGQERRSLKPGGIKDTFDCITHRISLCGKWCTISSWQSTSWMDGWGWADDKANSKTSTMHTPASGHFYSP